MKLYLAHPFRSRVDVRKIELELEARLGIELDNPFYDVKRPDVEAVDTNQKKAWDCDFKAVVEGDIARIEAADGIVALLNHELSIGTIMEIVYAKMAHKVIFVIDGRGVAGHPWVRYHAKAIFDGWEAFAEYMLENEEKVT